MMGRKKQVKSFLNNRIVFFSILSVLVVLFWVILTFSFVSVIRMDNSLTDISDFERDYLEGTFKIQEIIIGSTVSNSYYESRRLLGNCDSIINKLKNDKWFNKFASTSTDFPDALQSIFLTWNLLQKDNLSQLNSKMEEIINDDYLMSRSRKTSLQEWFQDIIRKGGFSAAAFEVISRVERILEYKPVFFSQFTLVRNAIISSIDRRLTQTVVIALVFSFLIFILAAIIIIVQFRQKNVFTRQLEHLVKVRTSELKRTQIKLIETERMAALVKLTRGLAHEFNTPLGNIKVALNLLMEEHKRHAENLQKGLLSADEDNAQIQEIEKIIGHIAENNDRNIKILNELQAIQPGEFSEQLQSINLQDFFSRIRQYIDLEGFSGEWKLKLDIHKNPAVTSYGISLLMVFQKLIQNTLVHSGNPENECEISISVSGDSERVQLVYLDKGRGIPEGLKANLFEPFARIQGSSTHYGLGLFSVHFIVVNRLAGSIYYDFTYNKGVKYVISLPVEMKQD